MQLRPSKLALAHPFAFAVLPILSLLSHNIGEAPMVDALRPALIALAGTVALLFILKYLVKSWEEAGLLGSLLLVLFFSYGHVYGGLLYEGTSGLFQGIGLVGRHEYLSLAWFTLFAIAAAIIHRLRKHQPVMTQLFSIMALTALSMPIYRILSHEIQLSQPRTPKILEVHLDPASANAERPDIYYIILDGYGRSDVLRDLYGYDNSGFLDYLRDQGFFIASRGRSNYAQTGLSLASSLNMSYLDTLAETPGPEAEDRTPLARLIRWSEVRRVLEAQGYRIVGYSSGYRPTELDNADVFIRSPIGPPTMMERLAIESSALVLLQDLIAELGYRPFFPGYQAHRERIEFTLEHLRSAPSLPNPKFVLAHVVAPHPPFVFGANGEAVDQRYPFTMLDGNAFPGTREEYIRGYRNQIAYVDRAVAQVIGDILATSADPPIILLQADHGPGSRLSFQSAESTDLGERFAILNAYYLPGVSHDSLYDGITPVNSFRVVFDLYFNANLGLLPDISSYSTWDQPYLFVPVP